MTSEGVSRIRAGNITGGSVRWQLGVAVLLTAVSLLLSGGLFLLTAGRCQTDPPGDTDSTWRFSTYCRALHSAHVFNFPDAVSGGGLLNAIFLIPPVCAVAGCWYVARGNRRRAGQAFMLLGASFIVRWQQPCWQLQPAFLETVSLSRASVTATAARSERE